MMREAVSSWPTEAFGSPCHEGARDLKPPTSRNSKGKRAKKSRHSEQSRLLQLIKGYRDAGCDTGGRWGMDRVDVSGEVKGRWMKSPLALADHEFSRAAMGE